MKKLLSIVIAILLVSVPVVAFGQTTDALEELPLVSEVNEYQVVKELSTKASSELVKMGFDDEEIRSLRNYKEIYTEYVQELSMMSNSVLRRHGYTDEQITILRSFKGTEEELILLSANLRIYASPASFNYNSGGRTTGRLAYNWEWLGIPAVKLKDIVAITWDSWRVTGSSSYVSYYELYSGNFYTSQAAETYYPNQLWMGAGHRFNVAKQDGYYYAKSGGGYFDIESTEYVRKDFSYYLEYGHSTVSLNVGFGVSVPGGFSGSISFIGQVVVAGSAQGYYPM